MAISKLTPQDAARMSIAEQYEWFKNATSRRSLLRGGLVGAGALAAGGTALAAPASAATASSSSSTALEGAALLATTERYNGSFLAPFARHVAFGPDPATTFAVTWQVPAVVTNPFVRIGHSPLDLGEKVRAELSVLSTPWGEVSPIEIGRAHV